MSGARIAFLAAACPACLIQPEDAVENSGREPLRIESISPGEGETGVDLLESVEIVFNQPLDPATLDRVNARISSGALVWSVDIRYDALERRLVVDPRSQLRPDLWYVLEMDAFPLSIMGTAYLGEPIEESFETGSTATPEPPQRAVSFRDEVWPVLSGCTCHGTDSPYMDFVVLYDTPEEFLSGSVATQSHEWPGWVVIDPGHHESSYLIYKLVGDERLGMPTVVGDSMPPGNPLPMDDVELVRDWIEMGAGF